MKNLFVGIDLHSNNNVVAIIDRDGKRITKKRLLNKLKLTLQFLEPYKDNIGPIAVESTFNWYWLGDGLMDADYDVRLAHPAKIKQYSGLKHTDDVDDAYYLAELLRLNILPEGHIYPQEERPLRDLNRKYRRLIEERTVHILALKSFLNRQYSIHIDSYSLKKLSEEDLREMVPDENRYLCALPHIKLINYLSEILVKLEKDILRQVKLKPPYKKLMTVPGIGKTLATSIALETGSIHRFPTHGDYVSYCRGVSSERFSNNKKKGGNNRKNGNAYLAWAYAEAAVKAKRYCPQAAKYFERKSKKKNKAVAFKSLAAKIEKACYYMMLREEDYDVTRVFKYKPSKLKAKIKGRGNEPERGLNIDSGAPNGQKAATTF